MHHGPIGQTVHREGNNSWISTDPVRLYWLSIKHASDNMQSYLKSLCSAAAMASELTTGSEVRVKVECQKGRQESNQRL